MNRPGAASIYERKSEHTAMLSDGGSQFQPNNDDRLSYME